MSEFLDRVAYASGSGLVCLYGLLGLSEFHVHDAPILLFFQIRGPSRRRVMDNELFEF